MNDLLLLILSIIGIFALYWVFAGQAMHNKMMMRAEIERLKKEQKEKREKQSLVQPRDNNSAKQVDN